MTTYKAELNGKPITGITAGGIEYAEKHGVIEIPDGHHAAHKDAETMGLQHGTAKVEEPTKAGEGDAAPAGGADTASASKTAKK